MTLNPGVRLILKKHPFLSLWAMKRGAFFFPKEYQYYDSEEKWRKYDLTSKIYILMKRLNQSYETLLKMDSEELDRFFKMEMELIEEEKRKSEESKRK